MLVHLPQNPSENPLILINHILQLQSFDDGTKRQLGELFIPLITIMDRDDMEIYQETFNLVHGIHSSPIVLTVRLRFFAPNEGVPGHAAGCNKFIT